jgi:hypothetical protein
MPEIDSNGVDRSQIRRQLSLTPFERLKDVESFLASTMRIRVDFVTPQYHQILFRIAERTVEFVGVGMVSAIVQERLQRNSTPSRIH